MTRALTDDARADVERILSHPEATSMIAALLAGDARMDAGRALATAELAAARGGARNGHEPEQTTAILDGAAFVLDAPTEVPAVWGRGTEVLWSAGESVLLTGPPGVGKSTIAQQLIRARLGIRDDLLGYPVAQDGRRVLLLALDRPPQIARSLRRMFTPEDRDVLRDRLAVVRALTFDPLTQPKKLAELVKRHEAGTLVIDSLYNLAPKLSDDDTGSGITRAIAAVLETGCEVAAVHHHRKATTENKKPRALDDVYGSRWITAGAGSVVTAWGQPGDVVVELLHLKQPAEDVGPLEVEHDHSRGETTLRATPDAWTILHAEMVHGVSAADTARAIHGGKPDRAKVEKVRRRLERFVEEGHARKVKPADPGEPVRYFPTVTAEPAVTPRDPQREGVTEPARTITDPARKGSRRVTQGEGVTRPPREWAARDPAGTPTQTPLEAEEEPTTLGPYDWTEEATA